MSEALDVLFREIDAFPRGVAAGPALPESDLKPFTDLLEQRFSFDRPMPLTETIDAVVEGMRRWTVHTTHPRYFGLFNPSVRTASVVADALVALYNPQVGLRSHSPAASAIETHVLRFIAGRLGYPDSHRATFTTGGSEANLTAAVTALTDAFPQVLTGGVRALDGDPVLYASTEAHHSFEKNAVVMGIGRGAVRWVDVGDDSRIDLAALKQAVARDRGAGKLPFCVVGTAGTTTTGAIDPLGELAEFCRSEGLWFHVDAAWGGGAALSPRLRPHLAGIELADSITCDAHKWLSVSMGAGMFFCRHPKAAERAFTVDAPYVLDAIRGEADPFVESLQWSRRFIGLKVFMTLAELGAEGMASMIEEQAAMGDRLRALLREHGWIVLGETPFPLVCFTHPEIREGRVATGTLLEAVYRGRQAWISEARFHGREPALRACITSFKTTDRDLRILVDEIERGRSEASGRS